MTLIATVAPKFVAEVTSKLAAAGYKVAASQLEIAEIERCTYDKSVEAGYVYLNWSSRSPLFANLASPIAVTVPFLSEGFCVDLDHDGNLFGVEFLDRSDFAGELSTANGL